MQKALKLDWIKFVAELDHAPNATFVNIPNFACLSFLSLKIKKVQIKLGLIQIHNKLQFTVYTCIKAHS